ncbi:hypothetical protein GCK72_006804 [Caenorhabditis remanei]|uniref:PAN-3 domain-containing protein n=1 Tax=Caenorhabditis remanei TaxID=31234 RepID=A0A6A5HJI7_CAERE|nr:hypothetical protein GCK72_006804 [Caenorhabditis remanei]KAF1766846.1 hypothetical protein GCK72_006804 [Caenorhabditis remanei]
MSTKIFLVVFFCAISINGEYVKKMIKLYGKVTDGSTKETTTDTNSFACVENCFQNPSCVLSFWDSSETCEIYFDQYGGEITVEETTEADLEIVAFKTFLDDSNCPFDYRNITMNFIENADEDALVMSTTTQRGIKIVGPNGLWIRTDTGWTIFM